MVHTKAFDFQFLTHCVCTIQYEKHQVPVSKTIIYTHTIVHLIIIRIIFRTHGAIQQTCIFFLFSNEQKKRSIEFEKNTMRSLFSSCNTDP